MSIEQAIKKAIMEGGYGPSFWRSRHERDPHTEWIGTEYSEVYGEDALRKHFLDPSFWQSLGKALRWGENEMLLQWAHDGVPIGDTHWLYQWHRFIDHLAGSGTAESFFETLDGTQPGRG